MWKKNTLYKHKRMLDVAFEVLSSKKVPIGWLCTVSWFNTSYDRYMDLIDDILITNNQVQNYAIYRSKKSK